MTQLVNEHPKCLNSLPWYDAMFVQVLYDVDIECAPHKEFRHKTSAICSGVCTFVASSSGHSCQYHPCTCCRPLLKLDMLQACTCVSIDCLHVFHLIIQFS